MSWSFEAQFLGNSTLSRQSSATGLGNIIQPLLSLYAASYEPKTGSPRALPARRLTLTDRGVIVTAIDLMPKSSPDERDTFYSMPSVLLWDAVRFVAVRVGKGKNYRGGFEPIDEKRSIRSKESLYVNLEKPCQHLATTVSQAHPVLFVLVVRRPTGVKALELQVYSCGTPEVGLMLVEQFTAAQSSYNAQQTSSSNLFNYNAFDRPDVTQQHGGIGGLQMVGNRVSPAAASSTISPSGPSSGGSELMSRLQKSSTTSPPMSTQSPYHLGLMVSEPSPGGGRKQQQQPASYVQSCLDLRGGSGPGLQRADFEHAPKSSAAATGSAAVGYRQPVARNDRVQQTSSQFASPTTPSSSLGGNVSGPGSGGGRQLAGGGSPQSGQVVGSAAGGALEGYYDMPRAVPLPRVDMDAGNRLRSTTQHQQLGRSKTFNGESPKKADSSSGSSSVLHRPLIIQRQIIDEDDEIGDVPREQSLDAEAKWRLEAGSAGSRPQVMADRRVGRSQTTYLAASRVSDDRSAMGLSSADRNQQMQQKRQSSFLPPGPNRTVGVEVAPGSNEPTYFMFGFKEAHQALQQSPSEQRATNGDNRSASGSGANSVDSKPMAMVQPRKVAGVRVLPENNNLLSSGAPASAIEVSKISPAPSRKVVDREPNPPLAGGAIMETKGKKNDGILNLRGTRTQSQQQQQLATDLNGNDVSYMQNKLSPPTQSGISSRSAATAGSNAYGKDVGSTANGSSSLPQDRKMAAVSAAQNRQSKPVSGVADEGRRTQDLSQKDREIASAVGEMNINYEPSLGTLLGQGSSMEKYLGYLP